MDNMNEVIEMRKKVMESLIAAVEPNVKEIPMPIFLICITELLSSLIADAIVQGADEEKGYEMVDVLLRDGVAKIKHQHSQLFAGGSPSPSGWSNPVFH